jgi:hypothetical protein
MIKAMGYSDDTANKMRKNRNGLGSSRRSRNHRDMILRVSAAFAKQFKCSIRQVGGNVPQERCLDSWSCHLIRIRRKPVVVAMNDATLYTLILPVIGVKGFPEMWLKLLYRIGEVLTRHGVDFDPDHQAVILLSRTNRSLIGSMNDAIQLIHFYDHNAKDENRELDLEKMEVRSNQTPYKALNYVWPEQLMAKALRERNDLEEESLIE